MKGDLPLVQKPDEELTRDPEEIRGLLGGQLARGGGKRYHFAVGEVLQDFHQQSVQTVWQLDLVDPSTSGIALLARQELPQPSARAKEPLCWKGRDAPRTLR